MQSEQPLQPVKNEERSISILPFDVQLQNIFALEVAAKRFPIELSQTQLSPIEGYTCKINPGGLSSPDCTNLTALYKQAQDLDFKAHIGATCSQTSIVTHAKYSIASHYMLLFMLMVQIILEH